MNQGLELQGIRLSHADGAKRRMLLDIPSLHLKPGEQVCILGPSGSGKTSLLHLVSGLILPEAGEVSWDGLAISGLGEARRDAWRSRHVGLIFQDFQLIPGLNAVENVLLPLTFRYWRIGSEQRALARSLLLQMGLQVPEQAVELLSRGEMQRVAIARAVFGSPSLLLADEPTASLDRENARVVTDLLLACAREHGSTLLVVTHESMLQSRIGRKLRLERGVLTEA